MNANQFLAEFGHIVSAPNGIKLLRNLILNLAVSGGLTVQDLNEQSSVLLEDIDKKREQLRIQGETREIKERISVSREEPWKLPENWTWIHFNKLCWFAAGRTPSRQEGRYWNTGDYPWFSIADLIHGKTISKSRETISELARHDVFNCEPVKAGAILMSFKLSIGKLSVLGIDGFHNEAIIAIHPFDQSLKSYFLSCMSIFVLTAENKAAIKGATLNQSSISNILIALPPREEIARIVSKIDELMSLLDKLETQQQERKALCKLARKAVFNDLATVQNSEALPVAWNRVQENFNLWLDDEDVIAELRNTVGFLGCRGLLTESSPLNIAESNSVIVPLPTEWSLKTLKQLSEYITSGSRGWKKFIAPLGDRFIRSQDIKYDSLVFEDPAFVVLPEQVEGMRTLVRPGDLLMTITGANVGKCALVPQLTKKAYVSQHVALIRLRDIRHAPFLHWWITNTYGGKNHLAQYIYGDKPGLNLAQVGNISIPFPPQEVQDRIVETLEYYRVLFDRLGAQVSEARNIAESLAAAAIASVTGIQVEDKEKMKAPKTELVSTLRVGVSPTNREQAALAAILIRNNGEMPAKTLWQTSGFEIDVFYQQLKTEMAKGWIVQPEVAHMREMEVS
jgi:type I restriction enzyme, S subunit